MRWPDSSTYVRALSYFFLADWLSFCVSLKCYYTNELVTGDFDIEKKLHYIFMLCYHANLLGFSGLRTPKGFSLFILSKVWLNKKQYRYSFQLAFPHQFFLIFFQQLFKNGKRGDLLFQFRAHTCTNSFWFELFWKWLIFLVVNTNPIHSLSII